MPDTRDSRFTPGSLVRAPYYHWRRARKRVLALAALVLKGLWAIGRIGFGARRAPRQVRRILVVGPQAIGDTIVALPALGALKRAFHDARIDLLVSVEQAPLFADLGDLHQVLSDTPRQRRALAREGGYDLVFLFVISIKDIWRGRRLGGGYRIGFDYAHMGFALDLRVKMPKQAHRAMVDYPTSEPVLHQSEVWMHLVQAVVEQPVFAPPRLRVRDADAWRRVGDFLTAAHIGAEDRYLVIHPFKRYPHYRWPRERWIALVGVVAWKFGVPVVISAGPGEEAEARALAEACEGEVTVAGEELSLVDRAALLQRAFLLVSVDTGMTHLADAVGATVVALFGPGSGVIWRPYRRHHCVIQHTDIPCFGCRAVRCYQKRHYCMEAISVDEVATEIERQFALCATKASAP